MRKLWLLLGLYLMLANWGIALADEGPAIRDERMAGRARGPYVQELQKACDAKDYAGIVRAAERGLAAEPGNADFHNMFAFGHRNLPNPDMALVFMHYNRALQFDPFHIGAHEYLGEAYLMSGNLGKAKEHLERVWLACQMKCPEYLKLEKAIQQFEAKGPK